MLSSLLSEIKKVVTPTPAHQPPPKNIRDHHKPIKTTYESLPISLPPNFLATEPGVTPPPTLTEIDWSQTDVPENKGLYAVVLDGVLTREECETLLKLAEGSVPLEKWIDSEHGETTGEPAAAAEGGVEGGTKEKGSKTPWTPALVNIGMGYEVLTPSYRNSSRIIWDQQDIVDRLWERCCLAPGLRERLAVLDANTERDARVITGVALRKPASPEDGEEKVVERYANGKKKGKRTVAREKMKRDGRTGKWEFVNVNQRLRFLRYSPGQFFRPHCDSPYRALDPINPDRLNETLFTIHLYLNDCKSEAPPELKEQTELEGGATAMLSGDEKRKYDVECKVGRVLIFQHRRVLHAGADVLRGVKYSVRTDVMYREVLEEEQKEEEEQRGEEDGKSEKKTADGEV
ncbi:hypothetical protein B0T20DRAFT_362531 [Sordaria brevicollis]|uniref:Fe2OG dioxygenase domain-containing protein n=1 Tax=Sordaria brevicollis TaxID=83679 RepID=A0AAE0P295_SORBR|nr:hypothetical protein B0T20DRAFT_362531 [Sordaria brevicollis]